MPIKKSAVKRAKQNIVRRGRNRALKTAFREAIKVVSKDIQVKKTEEAAKNISKAYAALDKAAKRNSIHKNKAARKKSRLMKKANALGKPINLTSTKIKVKAAERKKAKETQKKESKTKKK